MVVHTSRQADEERFWWPRLAHAPNHQAETGVQPKVRQIQGKGEIKNVVQLVEIRAGSQVRNTCSWRCLRPPRRAYFIDREQSETRLSCGDKGCNAASNIKFCLHYYASALLMYIHRFIVDMIIPLWRAVGVFHACRGGWRTALHLANSHAKHACLGARPDRPS